MFVALRYILWILISIFIILKTKKSKIVRKKLIAGLSIFLCFILMVISSEFPPENLFKFKSPEAVFNYMRTGKIENIVYGEESCMIYYSTGNSSYSHIIIPKTEDGYLIPNSFTAELISRKFDQNGSFDVYSVSGTNDYYINAMIHSEEVIIFDENDEIMISDIIRVDEAFVFFYVQSFTNEHYLLLDGQKVSISPQE